MYSYNLHIPSVVVAPGVVASGALVVVPAVGIGAVVGLGVVAPELGAIVVAEVGTGIVVGLGLVASEVSVVVPTVRRGPFFEFTKSKSLEVEHAKFGTDIPQALYTNNYRPGDHYQGPHLEIRHVCLNISKYSFMTCSFWLSSISQENYLL